MTSETQQPVRRPVLRVILGILMIAHGLNVVWGALRLLLQPDRVWPMSMGGIVRWEWWPTAGSLYEGEVIVLRLGPWAVLGWLLALGVAVGGLGVILRRRAMMKVALVALGGSLLAVVIGLPSAIGTLLGRAPLELRGPQFDNIPPHILRMGWVFAGFMVLANVAFLAALFIWVWGDLAASRRAANRVS
jgi:hypothetical protein